jgi:ribosomal protein S1
VPALIHQTEVSWDATLDPASYYKIGQVLHKDQAKLTIVYLTLDAETNLGIFG